MHHHTQSVNRVKLYAPSCLISDGEVEPVHPTTPWCIESVATVWTDTHTLSTPQIVKTTVQHITRGISLKLINLITGEEEFITHEEYNPPAWSTK